MLFDLPTLGQKRLKALIAAGLSGIAYRCRAYHRCRAAKMVISGQGRVLYRRAGVMMMPASRAQFFRGDGRNPATGLAGT